MVFKGEAVVLLAPFPLVYDSNGGSIMGERVEELGEVELLEEMELL